MKLALFAYGQEDHVGIVEQDGIFDLSRAMQAYDLFNKNIITKITFTGWWLINETESGINTIHSECLPEVIDKVWRSIEITAAALWIAVQSIPQRIIRHY